MRLRQITWVCLVLLSAVPVLAADADPCESHNWFQQSAVGIKAVPLLCQGILDASFDRRKSALHRLRRVIEANPHGSEAYQAHEILLSFFFRVGQYREALKEADAMLTLKPAAEDVLQERPLLLGLATNPDQSGKARHSMLAKSGIEDGNPHIPAVIDKKAALWFMDTGANISVMSNAEAAALGLVVHSVDTKMEDISGTMTAFKITEIDRLTIGRTERKHVSFVVLPHTQPPFDDIPTEQQALLGIQVLWALKSIHIDKTQQVEIAGAAAGNLGYDLIRQTAPFTIDFRTMRLSAH